MIALELTVLTNLYVVLHKKRKISTIEATSLHDVRE